MKKMRYYDHANLKYLILRENYTVCKFANFTVEGHGMHI